MPLVSIILPVYNAQEFVIKCINSILCQSYEDFELLVVNDGSQDGTLRTLQEIADKDIRVKVLNKSNGGVSSARNYALAQVNSPYVTFIDVDDYWDEQFLAEILSVSADLVVGGYFTVGAHEVREASYEAHLDTTKEEISVDLQRYLTDMTFLTPWGKVFKQSIIKDNRLIFDESMRIAEDVSFVWQYLKYCNTLGFIDGRHYYYYTESADYKYALNGSDTIRTMQIVQTKLFELTQEFGFDEKEIRFFIENYYIWLHKMYIKSSCDRMDDMEVRAFYRNAQIRDFYHRNASKSFDKCLFSLLIKLRLYIVIYLLIKLYH